MASLLGVVAMTGAAFAAGTATAGAVTPDAAPTSVASKACGKGNPIKAKESVKIRKARKLNSTAVGLYPKGAKAKWAACEVKYGQTYSKCGWHNDNRWSYINYRGTKGWVPTACENFIV
ncbi:hypothetical protein ABZ921_25585 [Streptomyces atriruber]|uniref:SH3 domain-containing protein n=1 Tax=Streptomyces atriruber TaxID=545121 RepID=A0ABV3BTW8_9ACTN